MERIVEVLAASAAFYLAAIALVLIAFGWYLSYKPSQMHWLAHRRIETDMPAEEQAEQIIEAIWPEEVI